MGVLVLLILLLPQPPPHSSSSLPLPLPPYLASVFHPDVVDSELGLGIASKSACVRACV